MEVITRYIFDSYFVDKLVQILCAKIIFTPTVLKNVDLPLMLEPVIAISFVILIELGTTFSIKG